MRGLFSFSSFDRDYHGLCMMTDSMELSINEIAPLLLFQARRTNSNIFDFILTEFSHDVVVRVVFICVSVHQI